MKNFINKSLRNTSEKETDKATAFNYLKQDNQSPCDKTSDVEMATSRTSKPLGLGYLWIGIFSASICAFTALVFAIVQNEVVFFEDAAWDNADSIALSRAFIIALMTAILSLLTSSYGFWRQYLPSNLKSTFDELSASLLTANGALCFCCFIMFMSFEVFEVGFEAGFEDGTNAVFFFAFSCFILTILFTFVNFKSLGSSSQSQVDGRSLI